MRRILVIAVMSIAMLPYAGLAQTASDVATCNSDNIESDIKRVEQELLPSIMIKSDVYVA